MALNTIRDTIDAILSWLKWPCALAALAALPGLGMALAALLGRVSGHMDATIMFLGGAAAYLLVWMAVLRRNRFTFFLTLEHELTHAIFAWLTLHRVVRLRATVSRGGVMEFVGRGNWLITISPYFFPLLSTLLIFIFWFLPPQYDQLRAVLLGASFTYFVTSKMSQTHSGQSDIQKAGPIFCTMLLPSANLLFAGLVIAASLGSGGQADLWRGFIRDAARTTQEIWEHVTPALLG